MEKTVSVTEDARAARCRRALEGLGLGLVKGRRGCDRGLYTVREDGEGVARGLVIGELEDVVGALVDVRHYWTLAKEAEDLFHELEAGGFMRVMDRGWTAEPKAKVPVPKVESKTDFTVDELIVLLDL